MVSRAFKITLPSPDLPSSSTILICPRVCIKVCMCSWDVQKLRLMDLQWLDSLVSRIFWAVREMNRLALKNSIKHGKFHPFVYGRFTCQNSSSVMWHDSRLAKTSEEQQQRTLKKPKKLPPCRTVVWQVCIDSCRKRTRGFALSSHPGLGDLCDLGRLTQWKPIRINDVYECRVHNIPIISVMPWIVCQMEMG
jgi:hypothetical protein